jgi:DNA-binding SARP family transcriptional activator
MNKFKSVLLLGNAKLIIAGNETNINNKIPMELLVLLIRNYKKIVTRDQLIEWLYPDYVNNCGLEKAKINLRKTVSRLNKLFGKKYISSIPSHDGGYIIDLEEDFTVDLIDYKNLVSEGLKNNDKSILKKAINMYRGPLLENFRYVNDEIQDYRIDLHDKMISICNKLMEYYILKNNKASIYELEEKIESIKNTI